MKRDNFLNQWNYDYPKKKIKQRGKENKKQIKRNINIVCWIIILITMTVFCNHKMQKVIANHQSFMQEKKEREEYLERLQYTNELILQNKQRKIAEEKEKQKQKKKQQEELKQEEMKQELKNNYAIGNPIYVTDINDSARLDSHVGKITKIQGLKIYGTWGEPITYNNSKIINISSKEMKETREAEDKKRIKENQKKKKVSTWGTIGDGKKELPENYKITYVGNIMVANKK